MCYTYSDSINKWFEFTGHIEGIIQENNRYVCDYTQSMELVQDEAGGTIETSFPVESTYVDNGNYINIGDWVWRRKDGNNKFAFDSEAERTWASILQDLAKDDTLETDPKRVAMRVVVGKRNLVAGRANLFGEIEPEKLNPSNKYLWGKNFIPGSEIKYQYCLNGVHSSYPDFIMKDCFGRIHLFEVKSVNPSKNVPAAFNDIDYRFKVEELKRCYKQASLLTGHIFYLPVLKGEVWHISRLMNGNETTLTEEQFKDFVKKR